MMSLYFWDNNLLVYNTCKLLLTKKTNFYANLDATDNIISGTCNEPSSEMLISQSKDLIEPKQVMPNSQGLSGSQEIRLMRT